MAARENQGLQLALIIFVVLTIILIVTTYMFFSSYQKEKEANKALATENTTKDNAARDAIKESEAFKTMIGAALTDKSTDADERMKKDLEKYGKGIPEANANYRFLVDQLGARVKEAEARISEVSAKNKELADKVNSDELSKTQEFAKYKKTVADAANDLKAEREKFEKDRAGITNDKAELAKKLEAKRKEHEEGTKQSSARIAALTSDKDKLRGTLDRINDEKQRDKKANEVPDGKVTWINQVSRVVWINLGTEDGLRRQTSFSVFDREVSNPVEGDRKAKIEVVRLMEPHLAEARIVEDDFSNPIMPGDQIFSVVWEPGRQEHFALAGLMDIDGDGESDRQRIRDLITLNGGVIDAEATDDGKKIGRVTINTRYIIQGEEPKETQEAKIGAFSEVLEEAKLNGVQTMKVKDFLNYIGYRPEDRTVNLGAKARPEDFKPRLPDDVQRLVPGSDRSREMRKPRGAATNTKE